MKKPAVLALAVAAIVMASVLPAVPAAAAEPEAYPIDRGIITLTAVGRPSPTVLQETGDTYAANTEARHVVGSPASWNIDQQRWRLVQTGAETYRFLNVDSGRALQSTNEPAGSAGAYNLVTTPASWNSEQQQFRVTVDGGSVHIWGSTPAGEREVGLSDSSYNGMGGVLVATVGSGSWTVSGYTFPSGTSAAKPPAGAATVDDAELGSWTFAGPWKHVADLPWTLPSHRRTESTSNTAGARATTTFFGTGFELLGARVPNGGAFRVTVDCTTVYEGDTYSTSKLFGQTLANVEGLISAVHTVVVEVAGSHQAASTDDYVVIDALRSTNSGPTDDGSVRWSGAPSGTNVTGPITLRRTACGSGDDIIQQLKSRTIDGRFLVPGHTPAAPVWGAVDAHAASDEVGVIPGPLTVGDQVRGAAAIALAGSESMGMRVALPGRPRTLALSVSSDEVLGTPVEFSVSDPDGVILPTLLVRGNADDPGALDREPACCAFALPTGKTTTVIVDLRDASGAGATPEVRLNAKSSTGAAAELLVLASRVTDVAYNRYARQLNGGSQIPDPQRLAAPPSAFSRGPVSLSRVLADADQPAWTGNQWTRIQDQAEAVPLTFGETAAGTALSVDGQAVAADSVSIALPAAVGLASTSSVVLRMDLGSRCRSLTASVGLDDATPSRRAASVQFEVLGDDQALPTFHNGLWQHGADGDLNAAPDQYPAARHDLIEQLHAFRLAAGSAALTGGSLEAYKALVAAEHTSQRASLEDPSPTWARYQLREPLRLGRDANWRSGAPRYYNEGGDEGTMAMTGLFPVAVDLMTATSREAMRTYATHADRTVESIPSPLVREIEIVISGTPGAVVDLVGAGLDCVSTQPAPDGTRAAAAMPTYSQIGVAPLFLPSPQGADGSALATLAASPTWWDMACPAGPSTSGLQYTAVRTRTTQYKDWTPGNGKLGGAYETVGATTAQSSATKPACGLPADQKAENYGPYGAESGPLPASFVNTTATYADPIERRLWSLSASGPEKLWDWTLTTLLEASHDTPGLVLWAMLLPFDLPVGLALNPFTMHALPVSAQLALGAAMLSPTMIEKGIAYAIPAASRIGTTTAREGAAELLLLTTEQAAARTDTLTLRLGDIDVLVPLKPGTREADLAFDGGSTPRAHDDLPGMPVTDDVPAFVADPVEVEAGRVCARSTEGGCTSRSRPSPWEIDDPNQFDNSEDDDLAQPVEVGPEFMSHGYFGRPGRPLLETRPIDLTDVSADPTWAQTRTWMNTYADGVLNTHVIPEVTVKVGMKSSSTLVVSSSREPLYIYVSGPGQFLQEGVTLRAVRPDIADVLEDAMPHDKYFNVTRVARGKIDRSAFIAASRNPNLLGAALPVADQEVNPWRLLVVRGENGGGIDLAATLAEAKSRAISSLANSATIAERADVLFPLVVPADLTSRLDLMAFNENTRRFERIFSIDDAGAAVVPTVQENVGPVLAPGEQPAFAMTFDWVYPGLSRQPVLIASPTAAQLTWAAQNPYGRLVFMKQARAWIPIQPQFGLSEARLRTSGFVQGQWQGSAATNLWIPDAETSVVPMVVQGGWTRLLPQP